MSPARRHFARTGPAEIALGVCVVLLWSATPGVGQEEPRDTGIVERTGTSLMLLDVTVTDKRGNPVRGLKLEDFTLRLNGKLTPLVAVDDFCPCGASVAAAADEEAPEASGGGATASGAEPATARTIAADQAVKAVLYFDFSQLRTDGRAYAGKAARRWVREAMGPGDEAMLAAYASRPGLVDVHPFTSDREALLAAIDEIIADVRFVDDFPDFRWVRVEKCAQCCAAAMRCPNPPGCPRCCSECKVAAREEYQHGRHALQAMKALIEKLERVEGRKALLHFQQTSATFPGRFYFFDDHETGDHVGLLEEVGAEATLARAAIYSVFPGESQFDGDARQAVNVGANLADYTGGEYLRGSADLANRIGSLATDCLCTYRLSFKVPDESSARIYKALVDVRGQPIQHQYRVRSITAVDRWWRDARAMLDSAEEARDVAVKASLVPVRASQKRWTLRVQVALDPASLDSIPAGLDESSNWEVGALLVGNEGRFTEQMLGVSRLKRDGVSKPPFPIVHEREFEEIPPGKYELRAFVRDRWANAYGSARIELELVPPREPGIVGPLMFGAPKAYFSTELPLLGKAGKNPAEKRATARTQARVQGGEPVRAGRPVRFVSWVCPGPADSAMEVDRYVSRDTVPLFRFDEPEIDQAGECAAVSDVLDTSPMAPGDYAYHVRWRGTDGELHVADLSFEVIRPSVRR